MYEFLNFAANAFLIMVALAFIVIAFVMASHSSTPTIQLQPFTPQCPKPCPKCGATFKSPQAPREMLEDNLITRARVIYCTKRVHPGIYGKFPRQHLHRDCDKCNGEWIEGIAYE